MKFGLYLHIPYCRSRCRYCDFHSQGGSRAVPQQYIDALLQGFVRHAPRDAAGRPLAPQTVYFGGGTPSLLAPPQVEQVLHAVRPAPGAEITLEANPEGCNAAALRGWRAAGVNRLSLGVQTLRDETLRLAGRQHTAADACQALSAAREAGFANISADVMLALPAYTTEEFDRTLDALEKGGVTHISAYMLKLEAGTAWGNSPPAALPGDDEAAELYLYAARRLQQAGYARYEISNFAKPGFESRHNLLYWRGQNWLGLGPAAHSCLEGRRFSFAPNTEAFLAGAAVPQDEGTLTWQDYAMLALRLAEGLDESEMHRRFGRRFTQGQTALMQRLAAAGLTKKTPGGWALSGKGMLVQNSILTQLFATE